MGRPTPRQLAQAAYQAYGEWTGGKNYRGEQMPAWDDLGKTIQGAWIAAAGAVHTATIPATQTRHPWRATLRTLAAGIIGIVPMLPIIVDHLGVAGVGWVATTLALAGAVTRVLAVPIVDDWLRDHGLLSAEPRER